MRNATMPCIRNFVFYRIKFHLPFCCILGFAVSCNYSPRFPRRESRHGQEQSLTIESAPISSGVCMRWAFQALHRFQDMALSRLELAKTPGSFPEELSLAGGAFGARTRFIRIDLHPKPLNLNLNLDLRLHKMNAQSSTKYHHQRFKRGHWL